MMIDRPNPENNHKMARISAEKRGRRAEFAAAWMLRFKGYRIVERRFRTKQGEVDLIARKGDLVAMVEVKARPDVAQAIDAVSYQAQRRIENAGDGWMQRQRDHARLSVRYDIVAVVPGKWPCHIKGAW